MASPVPMCAACLRTVQRSTVRAWWNPQALFASQASRALGTSSATSEPLYLDFLMPSTLSQSRSRSSLKPNVSILSRPRVSPFRSIATTSRACAEIATQTSPTEPPPPPQQQQARVIQNPRNDDDGNPMLISLTPRACHRLSTISTQDNNPNLALRVTIESGGCHGFQYLMNLADLSKEPATEEDTVFEGDKGAKVVIDESSLELLKGSIVDYTMELIGSQFKVTGIPGATSSCGCGTSFDIKF